MTVEAVGDAAVVDGVITDDVALRSVGDAALIDVVPTDVVLDSPIVLSSFLLKL